jgi:hypothetical protein
MTDTPDRERAAKLADTDVPPAEMVANWFLDNHQDIDTKHLADLADLVRRARYDVAPVDLTEYIERHLRDIADAKVHEAVKAKFMQENAANARIAVLEAILTDIVEYRGGAESAMHDENVIDRARAAIKEAERG